MYSAELNVPQNHVYLFKPHSRISDEAEPPKDAVSKMIWYNLGGGLR